MYFLKLALIVLSLIVAIVTLLPFSSSNYWWVRVWEFPRMHIALAGVIAAILGFVLFKQAALAFPFLVSACVAYQLYEIYPFTPLHSVEVAFREAGKSDQATFLAANVLMENREYGRLAEHIRREQADIVFLMEIDRKWIDGITPALSDYGFVMGEPRSDHYGLLFATRFEVIDAKVIYDPARETPRVVAELKSRQGTPFYFFGVHPKPPVPGQSAEQRDEEIRRAATLSGQKSLPVVAMGDFNVPAWSRLAHKFKRFGDFLDPRVGRGIYTSFNAKSRWMRFPIDQAYVSKELGISAFRRLEANGSDHFPIKIGVVFPDSAVKENGNFAD